MSANSKTTDPDTEAVLDHMATGRPLDPEIYRRIRAEGATITESIRRNHGVTKIAVDLIRESRDEWFKTVDKPPSSTALRSSG